MGATAVLALVAEIVSVTPTLINVGVDVTNLIAKARAALDANKAPDDVDWSALDQQVTDLQARLNKDPA